MGCNRIVRYSTAALLGAAVAAPAFAADEVNISGATLFVGFFGAPASNSDFIDADNDGVVTDFTIPAFDDLAGSFFNVQYRGVGSGNGLFELVNYGSVNGPGTSFADLEAANTADNLLRNTNTVGIGAFTGPALIDLAVMDVPTTWFITQAGQGSWNAAPNTAGYGNNTRKSNPVGNGSGLQSGGQSNKLKSLTPASGTTLNLNTAAPDANTVFDTELAWVPIAYVANHGTGIDGDDDGEVDGNVKKSELQFLFTTGRMANGENLHGITRDSGSGTRNGAMNSIGVDPSWGVGDNVGLKGEEKPNDRVGPNYIPTNKNSSSRLEDTIQNDRWGVGYTGIVDNSDNSKAGDHAANGQMEILNVMNDIDGGTVYVRPVMKRPSDFLGGSDDTIAYDAASKTYYRDTDGTAGFSAGDDQVAAEVVNNVIHNSDANTGWQSGGSETFATIGDPFGDDIDLNNDGDFDDPGEAGNGNPGMADQKAAIYIRNIVRSLEAFLSAPADPTNEGTPGQYLAVNFSVTNAVSALPLVSNPGDFSDNPTLNTALQAANVLPEEVVPETYGSVSMGFTPVRENDVDDFGAPAGGYSDGLLDNYVTNGGTAVAYQTKMVAGNAIHERNAIAGDFDGDGDRDKGDLDDMVHAYLNSAPIGVANKLDAAGNTLMSRSNLAGSDANAVLEILGDANADGSFDLEDVRYMADGAFAYADDAPGASGLATKTTLDRKYNFQTVDDAADGAVDGVGVNLFGVKLGNNNGGAGTLDANWDLGAARADVAGSVTGPSAGWAPTGADGWINGDDIDYVFAQMHAGDMNGDDVATWSNLDEAVMFDLSADMDGDLDVDMDDVTEIVVTILGTDFGDINLDGLINTADFEVWRGSFLGGPGTGFAAGDVNGDGLINTADFEIWRDDFLGVAPASFASLAGADWQTFAAAVPEPTTVLFFGLGLVGLTARRRWA